MRRLLVLAQQAHSAQQVFTAAQRRSVLAQLSVQPLVAHNTAMVRKVTSPQLRAHRFTSHSLTLLITVFRSFAVFPWQLQAAARCRSV
jgi:hypothetical protein